MNPIAVLFLVANAMALMLLPARWASLPLLASACYMTLGQGIDIAGLSFPIIRLVIAVGFVRLLVKREWPSGGINGLDLLVLAWAAWTMISSLFHEDPHNALINRLGQIYNACGLYFLMRCFCRSIGDVTNHVRIAAMVLIPLSAAMLIEWATGQNVFAVFGGVLAESEVRGGSIRAQGPFLHPILAGSVGATSLPLMVAMWKSHRTVAVLGTGACVVMVLTAGSSGPVLSAVVAVAALVAWRIRSHMRALRWAAVTGYVAADLIMNAPAYYLLARIDVTGSSTSWHRAALIEAAITHFWDWWLVGTDYTRHWLAYGVPWSGKHIDVTSHYLMMGINGGLALMLLFLFTLAKGFSIVGQRVREGGGLTTDGHSSAWVIWTLGCSLFAHAATFLSVTYFDQSFAFLYLVLAAIPAGDHPKNRSATARAPAPCDSTLTSGGPVRP